MNNIKTDDVRIVSIAEVSTPGEIQLELPLTESAANTVLEARQSIKKILAREDERLIVIVGPCSIHDVTAAKEYASKLSVLAQEHRSNLVIVMRVYFEKPRTIVGWKGLVNDPDLDGSFNINKGIRLARSLLLDINNMGLPAGMEFLDIVTGQYFSDLSSWGAIGARTTESQIHRELASGLSCPVGFKNGTNGNLKVAMDAMESAGQPHKFLSPTKAGKTAIFSTAGNPDAHVILRGGIEPNYDAKAIEECTQQMQTRGIAANIMVDFSHANSLKQFKRQLIVGDDVAQQLAAGDNNIIGVMIESHLVEGQQNVTNPADLKYGQSITDACICWEDTVELISELSSAVKIRRLL